MAVICWIVFLASSIFFFFRGAAEILYFPTVYSYTDDPSKIGKYDSWVTDALTLNPPEISMAETIDYEEVTDYFYFYENSSAATVYITVTWEVKDADMEDGYPILRDTDSSFMTAVFYDAESGRMTYVLTNRRSLFPEEHGDILTNPPI